MVIKIDEKQAQGAPARPENVTAKAEKERFKAILLTVVEKRDGQLYALIPPGNPREYPLRRKNGQDDIRDWALSEYIERFSNNGRTANYEAARADIWREMGELAQGEPDAQDAQVSGQAKRAGGRSKSKISAEDIAALAIIDEFRDWQESASFPGSSFARVPFMPDHAALSREYTGIWYLPGQNKPPARILDAALYFVDVVYPHASAKNRPHTGRLRVVNGRGQEKIFEFTGNELRERENNKFKHLAKWPQDIPTQARLLNAMEALFTGDPATIWHEQVDSLGYVEMPGRGLAFALTNGVETARGFIPNETAPVIGPELITSGNGYAGTDEKIKPTDEVWRLIFEGRDEEDQTRIAAKMAALMYTWFPPGTVEQAGRLPFYVETIGASSCGKTPEDNIIKSLQGIGFRYDSPPFLTNDDTKASAPARMQIMKHLAYSDDDRKCSPGAGGFQSEHAARKRHINYYADGQGAGSRYYDHATRIASRGEPQGLALGTSNYDHAIYALSTPDLDEDPIEFRACTFVVAPGHEIRDQHNSEQIFAHKAEIYATGRAARAWLMHEYNRDQGALREYLQDLGARARAEMRAAFPFDWYESKQENHCRVFIWGLLAWLDFLAKYGPGREQGYLYQKLAYLLSFIVEDRALRADYLEQMIKKRDGGGDLGELTIDAIRFALASHRAHIVAQNGEPLTPDTIPPDYGLMSFGYFTRPVLGAASSDPEYLWDHPHVILGHFMKRSHTIAFRMDALYTVALAPYARDQKYTLPRIDEIKKRLLDAGVLAVEQVVKVQGRNDRYLVISLDKLDLPGRAVVDVEEEDEKAGLMAEVDAAKITSLEQARADRAAPPAPAQAELAMNGVSEPPAPAGGVTVLTDELEDPFSFDPYA